MKEVINLQERLKPQTLCLLEVLVLAALFDPSERMRETAIKQITERYEKIINKVFVGDCQVMLEIQFKNGNSQFGYLCDVPKEYLGEPIPHPFIIDYQDN